MEPIKPAFNKDAPEKEIRMLACDPSLVATGLSLLTKKGIERTKSLKVKAPKKGQEDLRMEEIITNFVSFLNETKPDVLAIETQYINPVSISGALKTVEVKGAFLGLYISYCQQNSIKPVILNVTPMEAKQAVGATGIIKKRKESKILVRNKVLKMFPHLVECTEGEIDSVAIGVAGLIKYEIKKLVKV